MNNELTNLLDEMELVDVDKFSKWQTICVWVFRKMTGMKIGLLYKKEYTQDIAERDKQLAHSKQVEAEFGNMITGMFGNMITGMFEK